MNVRVSAIVCALAAALAAASASSASPPIPVNPGGPNMPAASATLSSAKAGARPVALTVKLRYEMVCGRPGTGTAIVMLPGAVSVPARVKSSDVLVDGRPAPSVSVAGHSVSIALPTGHGVTCMSIGPGTLTLELTRRVGLGNPKTPGTYIVRVRRNATAFLAKVEISA